MKKNLSFTLISLITLFLFEFAHASVSSGPACAEGYFKFKKAAIQTGLYKDSVCFLRLSPLEYENSKYRSFIFTSEGEVFIFHSFGPGDEKTETGAQVYIFPGWSKANFKFLLTPEGQIQIHLPNFDTFTFNENVSDFSSATGQIKMQAQYSKEQPKSVEILSYKKSYLDLGFQIGESPKSNSAGESALINAQGRQCQIKNSDIFIYNNPIEFKFKKATSWNFFANKVCP